MESGEQAEKWYSATALLKAVRPGEVRKRHLWERTVFLVRATDDSGAQAHAERLAREMEHEYEAMDGHQVRWVFQSVERVQELLDAELSEGTEVCWEFLERVDKQPS